MVRERSGERRTEPRTQAAPTSSNPWPILGILAIFCGLLCGRAVGFEFTRTDDTVQLVDHARFVRLLGNLPAAFAQPFFAANGGASYYRPLVTVTCWTRSGRD